MEVENNYNDYNKTHIQFQEVRDFGALMGAAFSFYKQEFKLLTKALLFFATPFVVVGTVLLGIMGSLLMDFRGPEDSMVIQIFSFIAGFMLLLLIGYSMVNAVIHNYTNIYVEKGKGNFELNDIWEGVKSNFFKLFFDQLAIGIAVFIGLMFFLCSRYLPTNGTFVCIYNKCTRKITLYKSHFKKL